MKKRINTRTKMQKSNSKIKEKLVNLGYHSLHLFPHMRFSKDYHLEDCDFDAFGWRKGEKFITFFQFKTNCKPSIDILRKYNFLEKRYNIKCYWINVVTRQGIEFYDYNSISKKGKRNVVISLCN